ncbi:hypothetical protein AK812_SmicGene47480, partial [Symbiodinium microadriaticum]
MLGHGAVEVAEARLAPWAAWVNCRIPLLARYDM